MNEELQALKKAHTWDLVNLSPDKTSIGCKWVYKNKTHSDGTISVTKGYNQEYGINYEDTVAPMARLTSMCSLLAIFVVRKWKLLQKNAFLNGDLQVEVHMHPLLGISHPTHKVCQLRQPSTQSLLLSRLVLKFFAFLKLDGTPLKDPTSYRQLAGSLVYLTVTSPDITYAVHLVSQFMTAPHTAHFAVVLILCSVKGRLFHGLHFLAWSSLTLTGYSDAD
ncbi:hypothetical protein CXB51_022619 [Gossypium anomalum]|uniref:Reverse transcriptase Ty1/copia-type domain-containing protein n=1 Tax=Gossypium anomalum TaxID=47600 RepID=A0A8J5YPE2_9ROSI|nr:hypothetical protein CXB51_022619 [Gossypium anomalum]